MKKLIVLALVLGMVGVAQANLEDFESGLDGWSMVQIDATHNITAPVIVAGASHDGSAALSFNASDGAFGGGTWDDATSPSTGIVTLTIDFKRLADGAGGQGRIYPILADESDLQWAWDTYGAGQAWWAVGSIPGYDAAAESDWHQFELEMNMDTGIARIRLINLTTSVVNAWSSDASFSDGDGAGISSVRLIINGDFLVDNINVTPEPATIGLLGMGALALIRKRRNA